MKTLTIRTDQEIDRALNLLTEDGRSKSEAVRAAILETERAHRRARMRAEADALRNDPAEAAAAEALAAELREVNAW